MLLIFQMKFHVIISSHAQTNQTMDGDMAMNCIKCVTIDTFFYGKNESSIMHYITTFMIFLEFEGGLGNGKVGPL